MMIGEYISGVTGWKLTAWIGAALGAAIGVAAVPEMSRGQQFITYIAGLVCGGMLAPIISWKLQIPTEYLCAVGFIVGVPGMKIVRVCIVIANDPAAAWDRFKGRKND